MWTEVMRLIWARFNLIPQSSVRCCRDVVCNWFDPVVVCRWFERDVMCSWFDSAVVCNWFERDVVCNRLDTASSSFDPSSSRGDAQLVGYSELILFPLVKCKMTFNWSEDPRSSFSSCKVMVDTQ